MVLRSVMLVLCLLLLSSTAAAQLDRDGRWEYRDGFEPVFFRLDLYSEEDAKALRSVWTRVGERPHGSEWEGEYRSFGDLTTTFLRWTPDDGFVVMKVYSCYPSVQGFGHGAVTSSDQALVLSLVASAGDTPRASRYVRVRWGERRYLVPDDLVETFCQVASGRIVDPYEKDIYPAKFFCHADDFARPIADLPDVPEPYRRFVQAPITARVVRTTPAGSSIANEALRVRLDAGSRDGLRRGMMLRLRHEGLEVGLYVRRAQRSWSEAEIRGWSPITQGSSIRPEQVAIRPGLVATTRPE